MVVPMLCASGWGRQRRNAELKDDRSYSENVSLSKICFKELDHRKLAVVMYYDVNYIDMEHNPRHKAQVGSSSRSEQRY